MFRAILTLVSGDALCVTDVTQCITSATQCWQSSYKRGRLQSKGSML